MADKELLLVGAGIMGTPYVRAARALGARIRLIETEPHLTRLAADVDEAAPASGTTDEAWAAAASAAVAARVPAGILGFNEPQVLAAAFAQDECRLPGPGLRAAVISRNKGLQRANLGARGVPQPEYMVTDTLGEAREWALARLPVVVKPLSGAGSLGVELIPDLAAFDEAAPRRGAERVVVEQAVSGPEYSWEGLVRDGAIAFGNITEKETLGPPGFVETGHRAGHRFAGAAQSTVEAFVSLVVAALGMSTGIVHLEFRYTATGPVLIELAVRTPGDYLMEVISLTYGVDLYDCVVRLALDLPLELPVDLAPRAYAASWMVVAAPGRIVRVDGLDEVRAHPGVVRARLRRGVGDIVAPLRSSDDRIGHVLVCAASRRERDEALAFARSKLNVTTSTP